MRVQVLGNLRLTSDDALVRFPGGKVGALFQQLLLSPGELVPTGTLCEALWPGDDPGATRSRLHVTVSRLRTFLKTHATAAGEMDIDWDEDGYRLHCTSESLDRVTFERLAKNALAEGNPELVDEALCLWTGEPYAGFEWNERVRNQRSRLADLHRRLVEAKLNSAESTGRVAGFLRSKFRVPVLADDRLLARSLLLEDVPDVGEVTVLSVTAPPGFGKSVFLSQWAHRQCVPVVWVTVNGEDNDPVRFWSGVVGAIVESGRLDLEKSTGDLSAGSTAFLDAVSEVIESSGLPLALVLDDLHLVTNPIVHQQLSAFVSALPPSATVAIASRTALPFATGKLGAVGRLHAVDASRLRFAVEEIEALVGDAARAESIWSLTEGWPVAVMALRDADASHLDSAVSTELAEYMMEEVLATVPGEVQSFLFDIAFLDSFNRQLCDAVTENNEAGELIKWLQDHQLFVLGYGSADGWFRLHHLVADELRRRAEADGNDRHAVVERRAARWFLEQGIAEESLSYAIRARDRELISASASKVLVETALNEQTRACLEWLEAIEPDDLAGDLRGHSVATCLAAIWGPRDLRVRWAHSRSRSFGGDKDVVLAFHDAVVSVKEGRSSDAVELFERVINETASYAAEIAPDLVGILVGMAFSGLVEARMFQGTLRPDDPLFSNTISVIRPSAPSVATFTVSYWALMAFVDGSYHLAKSLADEYYEGRRNHDVTRQPTPENSVVGALRAAQDTSDPALLGGLAEGIEDLVDLYETLGSYTWVTVTLLVAAALYRAGGDLEAANSRQRRAETLLLTLPDAPFIGRLAASIDEIVAGEPPDGNGLVSLLTERERVVLAYLATDLTAAEIAKAMFVSPSTIRNHISSIYRKLGVKTRHRAVLKVGVGNLDVALRDQPWGRVRHGLGS